jgi:hypothetical protein
MHRDRNTAKCNPKKRQSRDESTRPWLNDDAGMREHWGKAQRTYGARQQEAISQIREIRAQGY